MRNAIKNGPVKRVLYPDMGLPIVRLRTRLVWPLAAVVLAHPLTVRANDTADGGQAGARQPGTTSSTANAAPDAGAPPRAHTSTKAQATSHTPVSTAATPPAAAKVPPPPKAPAPRPQTDEEKALALMKKKQFDQACPLLDKATKATPDNAALWAELGQCEWRRGHRKASVEASAHAATIGDRGVRKAAYQTLEAAGEHLSLPVKGCEWLPESPGGVCDEQMWACGYDWQSPSQNGVTGGHAVTFGVSDDERELLETALREGTALRPKLAAEWKALIDMSSDELACSACHEHAVESADGLVNARAAACFQLKTGRAQPAQICAQPDTDCDLLTSCMDDAAALARRADAERNRTLWPEAFDVVSAAHKVCDATCGVVSTTRCDVVSVDACRGLVGYACIQSQRGRRPTIRFGELSINDGNANWNEPPPTEGRRER
jgi:hypothetical protein